MNRAKAYVTNRIKDATLLVPMIACRGLYERMCSIEQMRQKELKRRYVEMHAQGHPTLDFHDVGFSLLLANLWGAEEERAIAQAGTVLILALIGRTLTGWVRNCFVAVEEVAWIPRLS
jgi:hypothetical protein